MRNLYTELIEKYKNLNRMNEIKEATDFNDGYSLPHQGILRQTTKLCVDFYVSSMSINRNSLNDLLCKSGVLQDDRFSILIRFRKTFMHLLWILNRRLR